MDDTIKALYGRPVLPDVAIIYAGGYFKERSEHFLGIFDHADEIRGGWTPYSYARSNGTEYLVVYNVYGAAMTLEVLHLLKAGGVGKIIFIGLMFSKTLPVGTQVLVPEIHDHAGVVRMDTEDFVTKVSQDRLAVQEAAYLAHGITPKCSNVASVPCVLHSISSIHQYVRETESVDGVEMELSTFHHFSEQLQLEHYSFLVVSDNPDYSLLDSSKELSELRQEGRNIAGTVAISMVQNHL